MARRANTISTGIVVPAVAEALATYWRALDERWPGVRFGLWAERVAAGEPVKVPGETLWSALLRAHHPAAGAYFRPHTGYGPEHNRERYEVRGDVVRLLKDSEGDKA